MVAAWKPATMPVQPDRTGDADMLSLLRAGLHEPGLHLVHRLDRPVSGVVLFARTAAAAAFLARQFQERRVRKRYWAVVQGHPEAPFGLAAELAHDPHARKARVLHASTGPGAAQLLVQPLVRGDRYTLVQVDPQGGAFHQIRALLSAAGFPIKGDVKYGARRGEKDRSILLHARSIDFALPDADARKCVEAPAPDQPVWNAFTALLPGTASPLP